MIAIESEGAADAPLDIFAIDGRASGRLHEIAWGFRLTLAVHAVERFGIARPLLAGPATAEAVAERCGLDPAATEKLLILLAALALVYRQADGHFRLTTEGRASFDPASPLYFEHGLAFARASLTRWDQFEHYLLTGERMAYPASTAQAEILVRSMHDYAVRGQVQWIARSIDLSGYRHLLDLGGAVGTYSIAFCQRFPALRATVFDRASSQAHAIETIARFGLRDRVQFRAGDWTVDEAGTGHDAALMSNILHGEGARQLLRLERAFAALDPGGLLIVQDFLLDEDRNGPLEAAAFNLHLDANTMSSMTAMIRAAGFIDVRMIGRGPLDGGLLTARRP